MESDNQSSVFSDLLVTHIMGNHLHDTTKWTRFLSIVGIVFLSILLIVAIFAGASIAPVLSTYFPGTGAEISTLIIIILIVVFAAFGLLTFLLLRFSILTRRGLELRNQALFNEGLKAMKIYFIVYGVIGILSILSNVATLFTR